MDNSLLIDNIRNLCKKNKISISKLENDLFLSPGLISRWNKNMPSLDKIIDIAEYFGISIDELIGRSVSLFGDDNNIGRFLMILYQQSITAEITWEILNPQSLPKEFSENSLPKNFTENLCASYYTGYKSGFFILASYHAPNSALNFKLYILPDIYSRFECICSDANRLTRLYTFLEPHFRKQLNTTKAHNLMCSYIQENNHTEPSENEKITPIREINDVINY